MIIQCEDLTKSFKTFKKEPGFKGSIKALYKRDYTQKFAVENFSFNVEKPQIIGLLGPNGAGKTTLMKMFTGIIVPSSGNLIINGHIPSERSNQFRKKMALVMGQKSQLWWDLPALDSFELLQKYYEIPEIKFRQKIDELSQMLQVEQHLHTHIRKLSLGERMKLELMASLLHDPELLFLDEPTIGLDLISQENIRKFILDYFKKNKVTIIITSHYMADVELLCERLILILNGKKHYDGSLKNFSTILGHEKIVNFTFNEKIHENDFFNSLKATWNDERTEVEILIDENKFKEVSSAILLNYPVDSFKTEKMPIEKVMKRILQNPKLLKMDQNV